MYHFEFKNYKIIIYRNNKIKTVLFVDNINPHMLLPAIVKVTKILNERLFTYNTTDIKKMFNKTIESMLTTI